jgi:hypothetical protein
VSGRFPPDFYRPSVQDLVRLTADLVAFRDIHEARVADLIKDVGKRFLALSDVCSGAPSMAVIMPRCTS